MFNFFMAKRESSYTKFVVRKSHGADQPFHFQIFTTLEYEGVECTLWPPLYYRMTLCESIAQGQSNRVSFKISFLHKVLSMVVDYSLEFKLLQYQYDCWLFKTITGTNNSSRASGWIPNAALQQKSFSTAYRQWQHLYLLDAVHKYRFPSFITMGPYE